MRKAPAFGACAGVATAAGLFVSAVSGFSQTPSPADTVALSLGQALATGQMSNPEVQQAAFSRSASGAGLWDAYGNLLPQLTLQSLAQRSEAGSFTLGGAPFQSPTTHTTTMQWDFTHSLFDAGRDLFRIRGARADNERAAAAYDARWWQTRSDIVRQYMITRREQALEAQARREIERLEHHLRLAETRFELGEVTRSDVLQAELSLNQARVALLRAEQTLEEARLAIRSLVGGLPRGRLVLTTDPEVFTPTFEPDDLVERAFAHHPTMREVEAQERIDHANLWIARSAYLPGLRFQYSLSRSVVDTAGFRFSDFESRDFWAFSLNWRLFDGFQRRNETSRANASLQSTRSERRRRELAIEESVRGAYSRLVTAYATTEANALSVELANEDLRLAQARYETGAGSFVDLFDARVRAASAETDLIVSRYDFFAALVELERSTGLNLMSYMEDQ